MPADICMRPWEFAVRPFRIAGDLYYVGNSDVSSHLIDTGDGLLLIDTAFPQTAYLLLESVRRLGFDPDDIRTIVHCHGHYDHFGGTKALVELTGARTAMGEDDAFILADQPELSWAPEYGVEFYESFGLDIPLRDGQVIRQGDIEFECLHIPGHTPGAMAFVFQVEERGVEYTVGLNGGPGLNTLTDEYLTQYGLSLEARAHYLSSLDKLKARHVDITLGAHPGQNDTLGKREGIGREGNPFIGADEWPAFLSQLEANAREAFGLLDS